MVRLKAPRPVYTQLVPKVSIPYGTIKRAERQAVMLRRSTVSIPYGTIKSIKMIKGIIFTLRVSIPYGTIKSGRT